MSTVPRSRMARDWTRPTSFAALAAAALLILDSVRRGDARAAIVLVFPVVSGSSVEFAVGTLLAFAGLVGLFVSAADLDPDSSPARPGAARPRSGGVLLIGPVPIFFGAWAATGRRRRLAWILAGLALTALLVLGALAGFGRI